VDRQGAWLSETSLRRLARSLGSASDVTGLERLTGGLEADSFFFTLECKAFVFKRFATDGSRAVAEFENLSIVAASAVPTPEAVALDVDGRWFGSPALVMTALSGTPNLQPIDVWAWVAQCAAALAEVHRISPNATGSTTRPRWVRWKPPVVPSGEIDDVLARLYARAPSEPSVFSHDDYNPGNVLFSDERLSGVVDWTDVTLEPRQAAVALFRHLLAVIGRLDAAGAFLSAYETAANITLEGQPLWDVFYGLRGLGNVEHWVLALHGLGLSVTAEEIRWRSLEWIGQALGLAD
jgi:aminoglycoside phosphotransferase (APT) family kinase protein